MSKVGIMVNHNDLQRMEILKINQKYEKKYAKILTEVFDEMGENLIDFAKKHGVKNLKNYTFDKEREKTFKKASPIYNAVIDAQYKLVRKQLGIAEKSITDFFLKKKIKGVGEILDKKKSFVGKFFDTIKKQFKNKIEKFGIDPENVEKFIKDFIKRTKKRIKIIATTELMRVTNFVRHLVAKSQGVTVKQWWTKLDNRVRKWHQEVHGKIIPIDDKWWVDGEWLKYPGDPEGSPRNVINCRCVELYPKGKKVI